MQNKTMGFVAGCVFAIGIAMNLQVVTAGVEDNVGWDYLTKRVASVESSLATLLTKNNSNTSEIASLNKVTAPDTAKMKADLDKKNAKLNEMLSTSETISDTNSTLVAWAKANGVEKALEDPR